LLCLHRHYHGLFTPVKYRMKTGHFSQLRIPSHSYLVQFAAKNFSVDLRVR